jgi:hypothetical protein
MGTIRISITPRDRLLKVPKAWRRKFAEEAAELVITEGRYKEIMLRITGITLADLTGDSTAQTTQKTRRRHAVLAETEQPVEKCPPAAPPQKAGVSSVEQFMLIS